MTKIVSIGFIAALLVVLAFVGIAFAASTNDSATLDGGSSVTVVPGASITAAVTNTSLPDASENRWKATAWSIGTAPGGLTTCADDSSGDDNHQGETATVSFPITAPTAPGTYNVYFQAFSENDCTQNASNVLTLENAITVLPNVKVTIEKYVGSAHADVTNAANASFPMASSWNATNIGAGSGTYALGPVGFNNPNPYEATTADMTNGASYSTNEDTSTSVVGTSCTASTQFRLIGYTTGNTLAEAAAGTPGLTSPSFTNITSDKFVIVWNEPCPGTLIVKKVLVNDNGGAASVNSFSFKVNGGASVNFEADGENDITEPTGPYSVVENSKVGYITTYSNSANDNINCSNLVVPPGGTVICTVTNNDVPPPPANACSLESAPAGYTVQNGTPGMDVVTITPFTMFKGNGGNDVVSATANGFYIVCTTNGNDTIRLTGSGVMTIDAGNGKNTITVGDMEGTIVGGTGDDVVSAGNGARTMNLGNGNNTVTTGNGNQTITAGTGNDLVTTGSGNDLVSVGAGMNKIFSNGGSDTLTALGGNDFFDAGAGSDTCSAGAGVNTVLNCTP